MKLYTMTKPHFRKIYKQGPIAGFIDWIAGGNFDGYIIQRSIQFIEKDNQVCIKSKVLNQSSYDGYVKDFETYGVFEYTSKNTITVRYNDIEMRGKILGNNREFIAFSVFHPLIKEERSEVFTLD